MQNPSTRENPLSADAPDLAATAPGQLRVIKRNGTVVPYTDDKITVAITGGLRQFPRNGDDIG